MMLHFSGESVQSIIGATQNFWSKAFISLIFLSPIDPIEDWTNGRIWRKRASVYSTFPDHIHPDWKPNRSDQHSQCPTIVHTKARVHTRRLPFTYDRRDENTKNDAHTTKIRNRLWQRSPL